RCTVRSIRGVGWDQPARIASERGRIEAIAIQVGIASHEAQGVFLDPTSAERIVVSCPVVLEGGLRIELASGPFVPVAVGLLRLSRFAKTVVVDVVDDRTAAVDDVPHGAETVGQVPRRDTARANSGKQ